MPFAVRQCAPGEVLIEVKAAGMNFRDVLKALGLYPGEAPDARIFGDEVAGVVTAVGEGVTHLAPGDRVFGLAVFGLATQTLARAGDITHIPGQLSFEEAATLPVIFMTSWHALHTVARLRRGEQVLIHAGAGGVGMAAIQIAHLLGAEVIASAGSPAKRALLETMGVRHVIDSRRGDFAESVMEITGQRGVDVVLNALAGEAIPMGLSCLAEFGRFIEIGKRDIYQNSRIPLWSLRRNASFHVVAMDAVFHGDENLTREMLAEIAALVEQGALYSAALPRFPGKPRRCGVPSHGGRQAYWEGRRGALGGLYPEAGRVAGPGVCHPARRLLPDHRRVRRLRNVLAKWLVDEARGTWCFRAGAAPPRRKQKLLCKACARRAARSSWFRPTLAPSPTWMLLFGAIDAGPPLRGVFHLAMVIDDAPLSALTPERMLSVLEPKAQGAWLLHEATRERALDCFVMFSSVSSIFGNPAQGNYSAANAFLDALAHHRRALGLPALTINWGVLGGEGYVARNTRGGVSRAARDTGDFARGGDLSHGILGRWQNAGRRHPRGLGQVETAFFRGMQENPLLERIFASVESQESGSAAGDWRADRPPRPRSARRSSRTRCARWSAPCCASSPTVCATISR